MDIEIVLTTSSGDRPLSHIPPKLPTFNPSSPGISLPHGNNGKLSIKINDTNTDAATSEGMGPDTELTWNAAITGEVNGMTLLEKTGKFKLSAAPGDNTTIHIAIKTQTLTQGNTYNATLSFSLTSKSWGTSKADVPIKVSVT